MKNTRILLMMLAIMMMLSSCKTWNSLFGAKYGCPTNGKNIGAEKLVSGDPEAERAARKAKKFKS